MRLATLDEAFNHGGAPNIAPSLNRRRASHAVRPRIFVISLERCPERRRHMEALVARLGLEVEFVAAVDGRRLTAAQRARYDAAKARRVYGADMTDAEIGCYLSHYGIYQTIVDDDVPLALILEDDIECIESLIDVIDDLAAQADPAWSVVRLQSPKTSVMHPKSRKARGVKVADVSDRGLYRLQTNVLGGCAYMIRQPAAQTMLAYGERIFMPIDQTMDRYWENGIAPYVVRPFPVWQHEGFGSAIGDRGRAVPTVSGRLHVFRRRVWRLLDGVNKRLFHLASQKPRLAQTLGVFGVRAANLARGASVPIPTRLKPAAVSQAF